MARAVMLGMTLGFVMSTQTLYIPPPRLSTFVSPKFHEGHLIGMDRVKAMFRWKASMLMKRGLIRPVSLPVPLISTGPYSGWSKGSHWG